LRGLSGSGFDDQFWQTDAVNPGIFWESPHSLSIVGVSLEFQRLCGRLRASIFCGLLPFQGDGAPAERVRLAGKARN
jgi:hypothetical protein